MIGRRLKSLIAALKVTRCLRSGSAFSRPDPQACA